MNSPERKGPASERCAITMEVEIQSRAPQCPATVVVIWSRSVLRDAEFFQMIFDDGYDRKVKRVTGSMDVK